MSGLLLAHLAVGLGLVAAGRHVGRWGVLVAAAPSAATGVWLASTAGGVLDGEPERQGVAWVPGLGIAASLRLDGSAPSRCGPCRRARARSCRWPSWSRSSAS